MQIAEHQRRRFNDLVDVFDTPQPAEVMARLQEIVSAAGLSPGEIVLDVGTGAHVHRVQNALYLSVNHIVVVKHHITLLMGRASHRAREPVSSSRCSPISTGISTFPTST